MSAYMFIYYGGGGGGCSCKERHLHFWTRLKARDKVYAKNDLVGANQDLIGLVWCWHSSQSGPMVYHSFASQKRSREVTVANQF
eukprot:SAG11_NODE_884_length_6733_cov_3.462617_5_plen_84_part_00